MTLNEADGLAYKLSAKEALLNSALCFLNFDINFSF